MLPAASGSSNDNGNCREYHLNRTTARRGTRLSRQVGHYNPYPVPPHDGGEVCPTGTRRRHGDPEHQCSSRMPNCAINTHAQTISASIVSSGKSSPLSAEDCLVTDARLSYFLDCCSMQSLQSAVCFRLEGGFLLKPARPPYPPLHRRMGPAPSRATGVRVRSLVPRTAGFGT